MKCFKPLQSPGGKLGACGVGILVDLNGAKTHGLIEQAMQILRNIDHRGARGAEEHTGDGAGLMIQKPHSFFREVVPNLPDHDQYGVGQIFLPKDLWKQIELKKLINKICVAEGFNVIHWREVPANNEGLGRTALQSEPSIFQFFVELRKQSTVKSLDEKIYVLRRLVEKAVAKSGLAKGDLFYICSFDRRRLVYKGLLTCAQVGTYFPDLTDKRMRTALVLMHSRFGTNTLGAWDLAHPYRVTVHNGEINTLRGNLNRMKTREAELASDFFGADIEKIKPVTSEGMSDTAVLDNVLELLLLEGRSLPHALRMLVPEAWHRDKLIDPKRRAFYDFHSTLMEPWDGPALIAATDGTRVAAVLDRNGLRPCRYCVTKGNILIMASEAGVLGTPPSDVVLQGRLKPGELFMADTIQKRIVPEDEIFEELTDTPYAEWLAANRVKLADLVDTEDISTPVDNLEACQRAAGYTMESVRVLLQPMARDGKDPLGSMGNDTPPAFLSDRFKPLFNYFTQLFAQVSNPPLDYLREELVTTLITHIGRQHNILEETPEHCRQVMLKSPILTHGELEVLRHLDENNIRSHELDATFDKSKKMEDAIVELRSQAAEAIRNGAEILILSDQSLCRERVALPGLLAVGALHHHLIRVGLRTRAALVVAFAQPCAVHHIVTLIGYGADAIHPWLAFESVAQLVRDGWVDSDAKTAQLAYKKALEGGIFKVMSKMGISTLESYKGAQVFQTIGLNPEFVDEYFTGTTAHLSGVGFEQVERETLEQHEIAFEPTIAANLSLDVGGDFYWRRDGEVHQWNPLTVGKLQHAVRTNDLEAYKEFAHYLNGQERRLQTIRGLIDFNFEEGASIPIEEVEPVENIFKRFSTGSMSLGALSTEAHECLAIAMNRIGGKAGSGEGGEQVERFGTEKECAMKQVASGRFGVTINYLANAKHIEIKMAQGAKPGEGGELPGAKVNEEIASVRFTTPGVGLISPPPHHDIYSIEDLAQLIHDLKCANPEAEIHVKLVSIAGVGTIAAGVAKARADAILIAGDSGGTGAAIKTSIKSAGAPWEIGLAETQQVLMRNNLRSRVLLRADGGMKTGRDVVIAALLGAEEYGFGTSPMVVIGCIILRKCHCNTCSVGVATQDPRLRAKFTGDPEHVVNYMRFMAEEVRELMANLGFRTMDEMIGRVDCLKPRAVKSPKGGVLDISQLLYKQPATDYPRRKRSQNHKLEDKMDHKLIEQAAPALERGQAVRIDMKIGNRDRTATTLLSSAVAKRYGAAGLPDDTIRINLTGTAGQSFGAFLARGISLQLTGEANDYVGKGLSGGRIVVTVPSDAAFKASENIIIGNVALYGATKGTAHFNGMAGERFAVRNSGAIAVVEGVGDHGCEYMTGGVVVILGRTGKNFGAGMSGGEAFVYDPERRLPDRLNTAMISAEPLVDVRDHDLVMRLLENHVAYTNSTKAKKILDNWEKERRYFAKVIPHAYAEVAAKQLSEGRDIRVTVPPRVKIAA